MAFPSGRRSLRIRKRLDLLDTPVLRRRKDRIYKGGSLQRWWDTDIIVVELDYELPLKQFTVCIDVYVCYSQASIHTSYRCWSNCWLDWFRVEHMKKSWLFVWALPYNNISISPGCHRRWLMEIHSSFFSLHQRSTQYQCHDSNHVWVFAYGKLLKILQRPLNFLKVEATLHHNHYHYHHCHHQCLTILTP